VSEVADANQPLAVNKQQSITVSAPSNIVAMCDTDRIREAIDNLVSKRHPIQPDRRPDLGGGDPEEDSTVIRVVDRGRGPLAGGSRRLFGRFSAPVRQTDRRRKLDGLGLSIVKRIIDMHGGEVAANSAVPERIDLHHRLTRDRDVHEPKSAHHHRR